MIVQQAEGQSIAARMAALGEEFPGYAIDVEWYPEGPMFTATRKRWDPAGGLYSVTRRDLAELRRELAAGVGRPTAPCPAQPDGPVPRTVRRCACHLGLAASG